MAYVGMAYVVILSRYGLHRYGLSSEGMCRYSISTYSQRLGHAIRIHDPRIRAHVHIPLPGAER